MIKAIVAMTDDRRGIGYKNNLPWHIPSDLKHFKEMTSGCIVVMGYNTMVSLGKPLPNRTNIVIVRNHNDEIIDGFTSTLEENVVDMLREFINSDETVWVIGGAKTYMLLEPIIEEWNITFVNAPTAKVDSYLDLDISRYFDPYAVVKGGSSAPMVKINLNKTNDDPVECWYTKTFIKKDEFKPYPFNLVPQFTNSTLASAYNSYGKIYETMFGPLVNYVMKTHPAHSHYHNARHLAGCGLLMFIIHANLTANGSPYQFVGRATKILTTAMIFHDYFHQNQKEDQLNIQAATDEFLELYRTKRELFSYIGEFTETELVRICSLINYTLYDFDNPYPNAPTGDNEFIYGLVRDIDQLYAAVFFGPEVFDELYQDIGRRFGYPRQAFVKRNVEYVEKIKLYTDVVGSIYKDILPYVVSAHSEL